MPLTSGTRIGSCLIDAPIGAAVWGKCTASDARLKRDVAIEVQPIRVAADPECLTVLVRREARDVQDVLISGA